MSVSTLALQFLASLRGASRLPAAKLGRPHINLVAFSGGVDSSVVAAGLFRVFPRNSVACLGVSAAVPKVQLENARTVAAHIGVPLIEVETNEGEDPRYVENVGQSCYYCKTTLYSTMLGVLHLAKGVQKGLSTNIVNRYRLEHLPSKTLQEYSLRLFNGTNKDDLADPTRVGLIAANEFQVESPLRGYTKAEVREIARGLGLPNHDMAASPCLRSRLALGVSASRSNLLDVEQAESIVRSVVTMAPSTNFRVRMLPNKRLGVEIDEELLPIVQAKLCEVEQAFRRKGIEFEALETRKFRTGSVSRRMAT